MGNNLSLAQTKYRNSEKGKSTIKAYRNRPYVIEKERIRTLSRKEEKRIYNQRPEVKEIRRMKNREFMRKKRLTNKDEINEYQRQWKKDNPQKVNSYKINSFIKNGGSPHRYSHALRAWSKLVKSRDNNTCQVCRITKQSKDLHAHHFIYKAVCPNISMSISNGITLCIPCHKELHYGVGV